MKSLSNYQVSDRLPSREWIPSTMQIRQYAEAAGDFNPIHLDDNYARQFGLGGMIAHGMLTMAQMGAMLTDWIGKEWRISKLEVRFIQVVRPGEKIMFGGSIRARTENMIMCDIEATNTKGEIVLAGLTNILQKSLE